MVPEPTRVMSVLSSSSPLEDTKIGAILMTLNKSADVIGALEDNADKLFGPVPQSGVALHAIQAGAIDQLSGMADVLHERLTTLAVRFQGLA